MHAGLPHERRIESRVDPHLGDVVEESDGDPMGDGVNIAARLEAWRNQVETVSVLHNLAFVNGIRMSPYSAGARCGTMSTSTSQSNPFQVFLIEILSSTLRTPKSTSLFGKITNTRLATLTVTTPLCSRPFRASRFSWL